MEPNPVFLSPTTSLVLGGVSEKIVFEKSSKRESKTKQRLLDQKNEGCKDVRVDGRQGKAIMM